MRIQQRTPKGLLLLRTDEKAGSIAQFYAIAMIVELLANRCQLKSQWQPSSPAVKWSYGRALC